MVFLVADGSAKLSGRDCEFQEPTLRRESTVRRRNLSGESSHGDREEFQPEETKDDDREVKLTCREKNHSFFPRFTSLNETPPIGNIRCRREVGETPKHLRPKNKFSYIVIAGKERNSVLYFSFAREFVPMKRSQESYSLNFFWKWKQALVVSSRGTAYLWDNSSSKPSNSGVRDTLKCELGKKEVWALDVVLISELRESRVTYGSEDSGDLSLRDGCLGKPRSTNKRSFIPSNVESRWKGDSGTIARRL